MKLSKTQKAIIAIIIANTIWGGAAPIFKWSFENIHPFTLGFLRFFLSTIILYPFVKGKLKIRVKDIPILFFVSATLAVQIIILFIALTKTASINSPIIGSSAPLFLLFFGIMFLKEFPTKRKVIGGIIGFLGVMIIVLQPIIEKGLDTSVTGNLLLILATLISVINAIGIKKVSKRYNPLVLVFISFAVSTIFFVPLFVQEISMYGFLSQLNNQGIIGIIYATIFSSVIAYACYYYAIRYLLVFDIGVYSYLDPFVGIILAMSLLSEIPTSIFILGSILIFLGIFISEGRLHYHPFHLLAKKTR